MQVLLPTSTSILPSDFPSHHRTTSALNPPPQAWTMRCEQLQLWYKLFLLFFIYPFFLSRCIAQHVSEMSAFRVRWVRHHPPLFYPPTMSAIISWTSLCLQYFYPYNYFVDTWKMTGADMVYLPYLIQEDKREKKKYTNLKSRLLCRNTIVDKSIRYSGPTRTFESHWHRVYRRFGPLIVFSNSQIRTDWSRSSPARIF